MRWLNSITDSMDMCMLSHFSRVRLRVTLWTARLLCPWDSPGKNTGMGCHALLQGIFPTQRLNLGLLYYRQILYYLGHWRRPSGKEPTCNAGDVRDVGSIPRLGGFPGVGHGNPFQCSCLENPMDRGAWQVTVHRAAEESDTTERLTHFYFLYH